MALLHRAYSVLAVRGVDDAQRVIRGVATTPAPDRSGDVIDPLGIAFKNPLPLLWHHDPTQPVGTVTFDAPTKDGVTFQATLPFVTEPGTLKDRIDEAYHSLVHKLIRGVSVGFALRGKAKDAVELLKSGGLRFKATEVLELSLVTIPANAEAVISTIKSCDVGAATGTETDTLRTLLQAGATAAPRAGTRLLAPARKGAVRMKKPYADQISDAQTSLAGKQAEMDAVMAKAADEARTLTADEADQFDALEQEHGDITKHLTRLRVLERAQAGAAVSPTVHVPATVGALALAPQRPSVQLVGPTIEKGIAFSRYVMCLAAARGNTSSALEIAKTRYPDQPQIALVLKAAVSAGTTTDPTWAGALVDYTNLTSDFIDFLRPLTIIGRIPNLTRVPFMVRVLSQTSGGDAWWVGQGAPKPLTKFDFAPVTLEFSKVANIAVLTDELVRFSSPSAEMLVRKALAAAIVERIDTDFIDPAKAAVANVSPASITNGVTPIPSSGTDAAAIRADLAALFAPFIAANGGADGLVFIMSQTSALALSLMVNPLGQPEFGGVGLTGGTLMGIPVVTSQYAAVGSPPSNLVVLANAPDIYLADDGQVVIDASREASLQMDSAPTNNSATPTATSVVSLWQTNSIGLRAERFINWKKVRLEAVQYLEDVAWGSAGS